VSFQSKLFFGSGHFIVHRINIDSLLICVHNRYEGDDNGPQPAIAFSVPPKSNGDATRTHTLAPGPYLAPAAPPPESILTNHHQLNQVPEPQIYGTNFYGDDNSGGINYQTEDVVPVINEHGFAGTVGIKEDG